MPTGHLAAGSAAEPRVRLGARVLLLDPSDRVLLIHADDPDEPGQDWWELPGGGIGPGETAQQAARRELAEETGILADEIGRCLWVSESHFRYRLRDHHRRDTVYLARAHHPEPALRPCHTPNEQAGLIGYHWWRQPELAAYGGRLLPPSLPGLLAAILAGVLTQPLSLHT